MSQPPSATWGASLGNAELANALAHVGTIDSRATMTGSKGVTLEWRGWWDQGNDDEWLEQFDDKSCAAEWELFGLQHCPIRLVLVWSGDLPPDLSRDRLISILERAQGVTEVVVGPVSEPLGSPIQPQSPAGETEVPMVDDFAAGCDLEELDRSSLDLQLEAVRPETDHFTMPAGRRPRPTRAIPPIAGAIPPAPAEATRYVQGRLYCIDSAVAEELRAQPLRANQRHRLDIRIGAPSSEWTQAPGAFPDNELPQDNDGHQLTVVLNAPTILEAPVRRDLWLPRTGDTEPCSFEFVATEGVGLFEATVTVLYKNRILQTLQVVASIGDFAPARPLEINLQSVVEARLDSLGDRKPFDGSFLCNASAAASGVGIVTDLTTTYVPASNVDALIKDIRRQLEGITNAPDDYKTTDHEGTRKLLVTLAREGVGFRKHVLELMGLPPDSSGPMRLQVLTMNEDEFFPIEFCYERRTPQKTAQLCPRWREAVRQGSCTCDEVTDETAHVCPLAFWGMRHVIERRLWSKRDADELRANGAAFALSQDTPSPCAPFKTLGNVLFASATKAANYDQSVFNSTINSIEGLLSHRGSVLARADDWKDWVNQVCAKVPEALVIIGHTEKEDGAMTLQIGDESMPVEEIEPCHVRMPSPNEGTPGPIVLLFACRSAGSEVPFSSLVTAFRRAKASMIVGTLSTVLGRHMAPCAKVALDVISTRTEGKARGFGELLVEIRQRLLAEDLPVGLTLVGYGDVDWQIGGTT